MSTTSSNDRRVQRQSAVALGTGIVSKDHASQTVTAEGVPVESLGEEKTDDSYQENHHRFNPDVEMNPQSIEHEDDETSPPNPPVIFGFTEASDGNAAPLGNAQHSPHDHNEIRDGEAELEAVDARDGAAPPLGHDQHHHQGVYDEDIRQNPRLTWRQRLRFSRMVDVTCFRLVVFLVTLTALLAAFAVFLGLYISRGSSTSSGEPKTKGGPGVPNPQAVSTLNSIKKRGSLVCGVVESLGFSMLDETTQTWSGFEVDLCRAISAAIFENSDDNVMFKSLNNSGRFSALQSEEVDVLAAAATYTMERDLYESTAQAGFTFSVPYLYNGVSFAGQPQYVDCADRLSSSGNCSSLRICVQDGTTHVGIIGSLFPGSVIKLAPSSVDFYNYFVQDHCSVLAGEQFDLAAINVRQAGYSGNYGFSSNLYSKEPLALVTRDDDVEWSDFVNWVFLALLSAENIAEKIAENITVTQETAQSAIANPSIIVDKSLIWSYHAVATVGNYAEMYDRHLTSMIPRAPMNKQNNGTSPLIYSFPFGSNATTGPGPVANGTLETIMQRGYLVCGIKGEEPFFSTFNYITQEWSGFDVDYCRAVSAAIFNGKGITVFKAVDPEVRWAMLANGTVDILSRDTTVNYERDVKENTTQMGFTFAQNFYTGVQFGGVPPYGDCADGLDFSKNCSGLRICVTVGTTTIDRCRHLFADSYIVAQSNNQKVYKCLGTSGGDAIAGDGFFTAKATVQSQGYNGPYQAGTNSYSRENLAIVTRQDDPQWSSFVFWVVSATFFAAEQNITQSTYNLMPTVNFFGPEYSTMLQDAIHAVGSYDDIIARNAGDKYPVSPINGVNKNPLGPQHFPPAGLFGLV